jgi:hypothetical protein
MAPSLPWRATKVSSPTGEGMRVYSQGMGGLLEGMLKRTAPV